MSLADRLVTALGPDVAREFINCAQKLLGKQIRFITVADLDTPELQAALEAIQVRAWQRERPFDSPGDVSGGIGFVTRTPGKRSRSARESRDTL